MKLNFIILRLNKINSFSPNRKYTPPKLDKSKIRLVIYVETERGRIPYFDSNAIKPLDETTNTKQNAKVGKVSKPVRFSQETQSSSPQQKPPSKYQFHRLGSDIKVLEEMMFGSAAMAFKGSTLKIHLLRSPTHLMVSKVFIPEKPCRETSCDSESDSNSLPGSSADFSFIDYPVPIKKSNNGRYAKSVPVDVPSKELLSDYSTDDDSGLASFTSSGSLCASSYSSPNSNSISSYSSLHRRWIRAQTTALDAHRQKDSFPPTERSVNRARRSKLAVAILFGSHDEKDEENYNQFQNFFFSHFALFEAHVEKLKSTVEIAYFNNRNFLPTIMEALESFRNDVYDLYMTQRLPEPVWLTMMSATTYKTKLCEKFMETFTWLVSKFDNKNCKFFVSTLISAVLTQHLAWVATVTPAGGTPAHTYQDKHTAKWVDTLAKTHPYNPLWAQLGDLFGAIGVPRKISRTVVVGKRAEIVKKFLYVLSYFIRCSEVHENTDPQCLNFIVNEPYLDISLSPTSSEKTLLESSGSRRTPTFSASSSGGGRASVGGESQNLQSLQQFTCDNVCVEKKFSFTSNSTDACSPSGAGPYINGLWSRRCGCHGEMDRSHPKIVLSCDNTLCRERPFPSPNTGKFFSHKSSAQENVFSSNSSHLDLNDVFSGEVNGHKAPSIGMSELYIDSIPNSLPSETLASDKPPSLLTTSAINNVPRTASNNLNDALTFSEQIVRSQSFSGGKVKSRLAQQLESNVVKSPAPLYRTKSGENKKFLGEGKMSNMETAIIMTMSQETRVLDKSAEMSVGTCPSIEVKKDAEGKPVLSRQASSHVRPTCLARHRSVTPTGLTRRRHLSSTGSIDYEAFDPMIHCKEVKMPFAIEACGEWHIRAFDRNFGRSLLASYSDHYLSDFVLHGTSDTDYKPRLLNDLQSTVKHSILDEPIDEAVCVIADTDLWTVEVASSKVMGISPTGCTPWTSSKIVADLIESVVEISRLKMSSEFCLMHLEDRLQEIYFKSHMLSEYLTGASTYNQRELTSMLGFESSDMALLMAVAGTHSPGLSQMLSV